MSSKVMWPSDGSLVVGPIDPATKRGLSFVENCCATSRASFAAAMLISATSILQIEFGQHDAGAAERVGLDHVAAHLEEARRECREMMSGRLSTSTSLQFSLPQ